MDKRIKVSIVMLTYNHEKYIRQAINSILMQKTSFIYEIVVGDDCSKDCTPEILNEYKTKYPEIFNLVLRKKNIGVTRNLYDVCMKCRGEYIAFLEGDDYWTTTDKLQKQVDFLENHTDYSGVAHDYLMKDNSGKEYSHRKSNGEYTKKEFALGLLPGQTGTMCMRNFLHDGVDDYKIIENASPNIGDRTLVLLMLVHGKVYSFSEKMSVYRVFSSESSWSKSLGKGATTKNPQYEDMCYYKALPQYSGKVWGIKISALSNKSYCVYAAIARYRLTKTKQDKEVLLKTVKAYDESYILLIGCCIYLFLRNVIIKRK